MSCRSNFSTVSCNKHFIQFRTYWLALSTNTCINVVSCFFKVLISSLSQSLKINNIGFTHKRYPTALPSIFPNAIVLLNYWLHSSFTFLDSSDNFLLIFRLYKTLKYSILIRYNKSLMVKVLKLIFNSFSAMIYLKFRVNWQFRRCIWIN